MPALSETNIYRAWAAKQAAKGTPATDSDVSFNLVTGGVVVAVESGNENYSDGTAFGGVTTWLNSITGTGTPGVEGTVDELAWLLWMFHGDEDVSISGTNEIDTIALGGTPTGGSIMLDVEGRPTLALPFNATAGAVQAALQAHPYIGSGNVTASGGPWPAAITLTYSGLRAKRPMPPIGAYTNNLTGGATPHVTFVQSTPGVNASHVTEPGGGVGFWLTWWQTVGATIGSVQRLKMNDGRIGQLVIEASTGAKVLRVTPTLMFVDPGETYDSGDEPEQELPSSPVLIYTEGHGSYTLDGQVFTGQTQFQFTLNLDLSFVYGDDTIPFDFARGNVGATIGATMLFDDTMLQKWNRWIYNDPNPTSGTKPVKRVPPIGGYSADLQKRDSSGQPYASFAIDVEGVQWEIPDSPGPNPDQGSAEVGLTGRFQKLPGVPLYTCTVGCQQAAFT